MNSNNCKLTSIHEKLQNKHLKNSTRRDNKNINSYIKSNYSESSGVNTPKANLSHKKISKVQIGSNGKRFDKKQNNLNLKNKDKSMKTLFSKFQKNSIKSKQKSSSRNTKNAEIALIGEQENNMLLTAHSVKIHSVDNSFSTVNNTQNRKTDIGMDCIGESENSHHFNINNGVRTKYDESTLDKMISLKHIISINDADEDWNYDQFQMANDTSAFVNANDPSRQSIYPGIYLFFIYFF